jgi:5'-nucleotidase
MQVSAGFAYTWDATAPLGSRVDPASITLQGVPIDPAVNSRVTVNNFMADGGDGYLVLKEGTNRLGGDVDLDALEKYFIAQGVVAPGPQNRITRIG